MCNTRITFLYFTSDLLLHYTLTNMRAGVFGTFGFLSAGIAGSLQYNCKNRRLDFAFLESNNAYGYFKKKLEIFQYLCGLYGIQFFKIILRYLSEYVTDELQSCCKLLHSKNVAKNQSIYLHYRVYILIIFVRLRHVRQLKNIS